MDEQEIQAKQQREVKGAEAEAEDVNDDAVNSVGQGSAWPGVIRTATHLSNTADNTSTAYVHIPLFKSYENNEYIYLFTSLTKSIKQNKNVQS